MKTRTLLILAVSCGLVILVAGALLLLQLSNQDEVSPALHVGDKGRAGDAVITVEGFEVADDAIEVTVTLSGVDADLSGFRLIVLATNKAIPVDSPSAAVDTDLPLCVQFTVEPKTCVLRFSATDLDDVDAVLRFERATEHVRWSLA